MGTQPDPMSKYVRRKILDVFRVNLRSTAHQYGPYFRKTRPADNRSRRSTQINTMLDKFRWGMFIPTRLGIAGTSRRDQPLDIFREQIMQEDLFVDRRAQFDNALFS